MADTPVEFFAPVGLTLTVQLYPFGSDTIANGAGDSAIEKANRKGLYEITVSEALSGWHTAHILKGGDHIGRFSVYLENDAVAKREFDGRVPVEQSQVTLATLQGNYAPAKAGDAMDLVNAPNAAAINAFATEIDVTTHVQNVIETNHLDHLFASEYDPANKPGVSTALCNELIVNDDGASQFSTNALENAPGGGGSVENTVVISATSVAAKAANNAGQLLIVKHNTFRAQITGLGSLSGLDALYFTIKCSPADVDSDAIIQLSEGGGLDRINGAAAEDSLKGSLTVDDGVNGDVTIYLDEEMTGLLAVASRLFWSIKIITTSGDANELTDVDYDNGAKTWAKVIQGVGRQVP